MAKLDTSRVWSSEKNFVVSCIVWLIVLSSSTAWSHYVVEDFDVTSLTTNTSGRIPLFIGTLLPLTKNGDWAEEYANQSMVAMDMAIEDINNRTDILPDHELHLIVKNTRGSSATALNLLYEMILSSPQMIAFVGSIESDITKILAEVTGTWGIVQMGFANSAIGLSNHDLYPYFIRTMGSSTDLNQVKVQICQRFGWKRVYTLTEATEPHAGIMDDLHELLEYENISLISRQSFYYDPAGAIARLKAMDARIIIGSFFEETARRVICQVFRKDFRGPKRVFIFRGYVDNDWWRTSDKPENLPCSDSDMLAALQSMITVYFSMNARKDRMTFAKRTAESFRTEMETILGSQIRLNNRDVAANAHDAIWALAYGLNNSIELLNNTLLEDYRYKERHVADIIYRQVLKAEFYGVSGPVGFKEDGDRIGAFIIQEIREDESRIVIGTLQQGSRINWIRSPEEIWERNNGRAPFDEDRTEEIFLKKSINFVIVIVIGVISTLGIGVALFFLAFNIKNRKKRHIKMSSPNLNNLIIGGICLAYLCVVLLGLDIPFISERNQILICGSRLWLMSLAFTIAFGGMFTKMWRVYNIVINKRTMRKVIKDRHLFAIILVLLFIDVVILVTKQIIDPYYVIDDYIEQPRTQEDRANFVVYIFEYRRCATNYNTVWTAILVVYKTFVMLFGAFLSFQTRNVAVPGLNDSYYVGLSIYNACLCCAVAVPLSIFNSDSINVTYTVTTGFIIFCSTSILCMLFLPKMSALYRQQHTVGMQQRFAVNTVSSVAGTSRSLTSQMVGRDPTQLGADNPINRKVLP